MSISEQDRIAFLEQKLAEQAEENFELQAALAVAEAECQHQIQSVERTLQQTERNLRDQLRRSQHEANLVRAQSKHQQQQQRIPDTIITSAHPVISNPRIQQPKSPTLSKDNDHTIVTVKEVCGFTLARHLLLVMNRQQQQQQLSPLTPLLLRVVACHRPISAVDLIEDCIDSFVGSSQPWTARHLESLHHALQLSPQACRAMADPDHDQTTTTTTFRTTGRIRIRGEHVNLPVQQLDNPLWSPTMSPLETTIEQSTTPRRKRNYGAFVKRLQEQCILQTLELPLSMAGMKVACLLLPHLTEQVWPILTELLTFFRKAALRLMGRSHTTIIRLLNPDSNEEEGNNANTERYSFLKRHKSKDLQEWLAVCLATLVEFWNDSRRDASRTGFWTGSKEPVGPLRNVMATVLDVMEHVILQDSALYTSKLAFSCVSWFHAMLHNNASVHWLLTQMPTSQSTPETWHRACSGVGVMVKFSHAVVIHQDIETEQGTNLNNHWNVIRDQSIRFFQGILRMMQSQRREWERQPVQSKKPPSFSSLVAFEYPELYTSMVTALLFVDTQTTTGLVLVSSDVQSMLQQQLEEIKMDQQERDDEVVLASMKQ